MRENDSILLIKEYGKIHLHLDTVLKERGMTRNALARAANTRFEVIDRWYKNKVEILDLDVLARVCYVLGCNVSDILEYQEETKEKENTVY